MGESHEDHALHIATHAAGGWFVSKPLLEFESNCRSLFGYFTVEKASVKPVAPGGASALVVRLHVDSGKPNWGDSTTGLVVLGVGASGRPSLIGPITIGTGDRRGHVQEPEVEDTEGWDARFEGDALVVHKKTIKRAKGSRSRSHVEHAPARYPIVFP